MFDQEIEIPQEVLDKAVVWACTQIHFTIGELCNKLHRCRLSQEDAYRAGAQLLKQWKADSKIMFRKGQWHWQV